MNMNLWLLVRQAGAAACLRFRPAPFYAYGLPVFALVLAAVGMVNAVALKPFLGASDAALGFGFLTAVTRWLVLSRVFWEMLRAPNGERVPFLGYILATDALVIPTLFALPYPEMRSWVGLWNTWCFGVQFAGAVAVSGQRPLRVAGAYLVYWLASSALLFVFLLMFVSAGWFDVNELNANVIKMLETMRAQH